MRKILLSLLFVSLVCVSAFAIWNPFGSKTVTPNNNEAELCAVLASLAPTEAEAKAIAKLREKTSIQLAGQQREEWARLQREYIQQRSQQLQRLTEKQNDPSTHADLQPILQRQINVVQQQMSQGMLLPMTASNDLTTGSDQEPPVEAEPVKDESIQIAVVYRLFSDTESLAKTITGHPAMAWSPLPVATPFLSTGTPPGTFSHSVSVQMPMHVRYLEPSNVEKFYNLFRSRRASTIMESPRFIVSNGQEEILSDTTAIPFVTSVLPVEELGDEPVYHPIIQLLGQGQTYTTKATLLQDGSYRLSSRVEFTTIRKVEQYRLVDTPPTPQQLAEYPRTKGGITIQVPSFHTFRVHIPDIVIPDGMSLLVAFPGGNIAPESNSSDSPGIFMLITPQKVEDE